MKTIETIKVNPDRCFITPHQSRIGYDEEALQSLAQTLKTTGQLQNGVGRVHLDGRLEIFNGCRRYLATIKAGLTEFEVKIVEATDAEVIKNNLLENMQREGLKPLEIANAVKRALEIKGESGQLVYSKVGLAEELGLTVQEIERYGHLLNAPEALQRKANNGEVETTLVMIVGSLPPEMQQDAITAIITCFPKPKTEKEALRWVADNCRRDLRKASFQKTDDTLVAGLPACIACSQWGGNHPDIVGKQKGSVCLNPVCFIKKQEASAEILRRHAESQPGVHIMPEADVRKYIDPDSGAVLPAAPFVDLDARPHEALLKNPNTEAPKWETVMQDSGAEIHWAIDGDGKQRKLVTLGTALAWARMEGNPHRGIFKPVSGAKAPTAEEDSLEKLKTAAGSKAEAEGVLAAATAFMECLTVPWTREMQLAFLKAECEKFSKDDFEFVCRVMRPDLKKIADGKTQMEEMMAALERPEQLWAMIGLCKWARSFRVSPLWTLAPETHASQTVLFKSVEFDGLAWRDTIKNMRANAEKAAEKEFKAKQKADQPSEPKLKRISPEGVPAEFGPSKETKQEISISGTGEVDISLMNKGEMMPSVSSGTCMIFSSAQAAADFTAAHITPGTLDEYPPTTTERVPAPDNEEMAWKKWLATGSIKQAAEAAGVHVDTVKNWHKRRKWVEKRLKAEQEEQGK